MPTYLCDDGNAEIEITADSALEAAQEYVDGGDWGDDNETFRVDVYVQQDASEIEDRLRDLIGDHKYSDHGVGWWVYAARDLDIDAVRAALPECEVKLDDAGDLDVSHNFERECITITVEPDEPECADGHDHDWQSPHDVLGGLKDNPGVWGNGGGVIIKEVCAHCGKYRVTDTWVNHGGQQGFTDVSYEDADAASSEWVESMIEE